MQLQTLLRPKETSSPDCLRVEADMDFFPWLVAEVPKKVTKAPIVATKPVAKPVVEPVAVPTATTGKLVIDMGDGNGGSYLGDYVEWRYT